MAYELGIRDDGIARLATIGDQGKEDVENLRKHLEALVEAATEAEPMGLIVDSSRSGKTSSAARKLYVELGRDSRFGKTALLGARRYSRLLATFIAKATGRDNIGFFDSEEEALAWLKAES